MPHGIMSLSKARTLNLGFRFVTVGFETSISPTASEKPIARPPSQSGLALNLLSVQIRKEQVDKPAASLTK